MDTRTCDDNDASPFRDADGACVAVGSACGRTARHDRGRCRRRHIDTARHQQDAASNSDRRHRRARAHSALWRACEDNRWPRWRTDEQRALDCPKIDRYGRAVCRVYIDGIDVGLEQIRRGLAWHYVRYAHEQRETDRNAYAEGRARRAFIADRAYGRFNDPTPPWNYRRTRAALSFSESPVLQQRQEIRQRRLGFFKNAPRITLLTIFESVSLTPRHCMQK